MGLANLAVEIGNVTPANIQQLRTINISTLPVRYSDKFYRDLISNGFADYMKFAIWNGFTVGAVCARVESIENSSDKKLYIMTINVLPAYRRRGIASFLLKHVLQTATADSNIAEVYLHVQTSNTEAFDFYLAHKFEHVGVVDNYYKRIEPPNANLLRMPLSGNTSISTNTITRDC